MHIFMEIILGQHVELGLNTNLFFTNLYHLLFDPFVSTIS